MNRSTNVLVLAAVCVVCAGAPAAFDPPPAKEPVANGKPLSYWIAALKDPEAAVREEAVLVLTDLGPAAKDAVPALTPLLKDTSLPVRVKAATALVHLDRGQIKTAVPVLCEAVKNGPSAERLQTVQLLGQLGADAKDAGPTLINVLNDPDANLRTAARAALVRLGDAAVSPLKDALAHKDPGLRLAVIEILGQIGPPAKDAVPALKERLQDEDRLTRVAAAQALYAVATATDAVLPVLVEAQKDNDLAVRRAAWRTLFGLQPRPKEALPLFTAGLKDADPRTRVRSAQALWETNHKADEVLPVLVAVLKNPKDHAEALALALTTLEAMGPAAREAQAPLVALVKTVDPGPDADRAADAVGAIGAPAVPALAELLTDTQSTPYVRYLAVRALGNAGPDGAAELVKHLEAPGHGDQARRTLWQMGPAAVGALPKLIEMAKSTDAASHSTAAYILWQIGPDARPAAPALLGPLLDAQPQTVNLALQALRTIQPDPKVMLPVLRAALKDATPAQRITLADAMISVDPTDTAVVPTLVELLDDKSVGVLAAFQLGRLGRAAKEAVPALVKVIQTPNNPGRAQALVALQGIGPDAKAAVPALLELLKTEQNANTRTNAVLALKATRVDSKEVIAAMLAIADGKGPDSLARPHALDVLGQCGKQAKDAAPTLVELLTHTDPMIRLHAADALVRVDPEGGKDKAVAALTDLLATSGNVRVLAVGALLALDKDNRAALDAVHTALTDPSDFNSRLFLLDALGRAGPDARKSLPDVRAGLKDPSPVFRGRAALALWYIDKEKGEALDVLIDMVSRKENTFNRNAGASALGAIGPDAKKALPALFEARKDRDFSLRVAANEAIKKIDPEAFARIGVPEKK